MQSSTGLEGLAVHLVLRVCHPPRNIIITVTQNSHAHPPSRKVYHGLARKKSELISVSCMKSRMSDLQLKEIPIAKTGMLIRRPAAEVFEAFINPEITSKFWFTKGSGKLEVDNQVQWEWEMYGISIPVTAKLIEKNKRIVIEWPGQKGPTTVEWTFLPQHDGTTFVRITDSGFTGDGDELVKQVADSTQGFSLVLAGLKAWLEHKIQLNLVGDRYPKGIEDH